MCSCCVIVGVCGVECWLLVVVGCWWLVVEVGMQRGGPREERESTGQDQPFLLRPT